MNCLFYVSLVHTVGPNKFPVRSPNCMLHTFVSHEGNKFWQILKLVLLHKTIVQPSCYLLIYLFCSQITPSRAIKLPHSGHYYNITCVSRNLKQPLKLFLVHTNNSKKYCVLLSTHLMSIYRLPWIWRSLTSLSMLLFWGNFLALFPPEKYNFDTYKVLFCEKNGHNSPDFDFFKQVTKFLHQQAAKIIKWLLIFFLLSYFSIAKFG